MQEYKIVVQGTRKIITYLKSYIKIPNKLYYFSKQNENYFKKLRTADVVITMSWGKTMWGGTENLKVPEVQKLKLIHLSSFSSLIKIGAISLIQESSSSN